MNNTQLTAGTADDETLTIPRFSLWQNIVGVLSTFFPFPRDKSTFASEAETRFLKGPSAAAVQAGVDALTPVNKSWVRSFDDLDFIPADVAQENVVSEVKAVPVPFFVLPNEENFEPVTDDMFDIQDNEFFPHAAASSGLSGEFLNTGAFVQRLHTDGAKASVWAHSFDNMDGELDAGNLVMSEEDAALADIEELDSSWLSLDEEGPGLRTLFADAGARPGWAQGFADLDCDIHADKLELISARDAACADDEEFELDMSDLHDVEDEVIELQESDILPDTIHTTARALRNVPEAWQGAPVLHLSFGGGAERDVVINLATAPSSVVEDYLRSFPLRDGQGPQSVSVASALNMATHHPTARAGEAAFVTYLPPLDAAGRSIDGDTLGLPMNESSRQLSSIVMKSFLSDCGFITSAVKPATSSAPARKSDKRVQQLSA